MVATDDVLATRKPGPNVLVHRPASQDSLEPACGAAATEPFNHFGAYHLQLTTAMWCRENACYPKGWASE